jgi:hypothetical protein
MAPSAFTNGLGLEITPQALGAAPRQRVLHRHRAAQPHDVLGLVRARDAAPARIVLPVELELFGAGERGFHVGLPY